MTLFLFLRSVLGYTYHKSTGPMLKRHAASHFQDFGVKSNFAGTGYNEAR